MEVIKTIAEMRQVRLRLAEPVGFVPTMGYLHEGHISLIRQAKMDNSSVVVSIFVNPTQFSTGEDFGRYPRNLESDLSQLKKEDVDAVFVPTPTEIYPTNFSSRVEVDKITQRLEGVSRPGHFSGVTTIVAKLFNIIQPTRAYFGQKDAQQATVINKMIVDLNMNLTIITLPTVREPDGLAISSRNSYLNPKERKAALVLYQSLMLAKKLWHQGERDVKTLRREMVRLIRKEPLAIIDYISFADPLTLWELEEVKPPTLVSLAVKIGETRLIDNLVLE
ncbi:MAG: pantoate--beta-alanine ligase [Dehalococcoidia bacterium]|nr:MAG: pantoate--beta-alanine ligase [Dehalococcoidia bacterium]